MPVRPRSRGSRRLSDLLIVVVVGALCGAATLGEMPQRVEDEIGLRWLFLLRGARPAPASVAIIAMDEDSAGRLALPNDVARFHRCEGLEVDGAIKGYMPLPSPRSRRWPRCIHAMLVDALRVAGARTVVFDVVFGEGDAGDGPPALLAEEDRRLAGALKAHGGVLLAERLPFMACPDREPDCRGGAPKDLSPPVREAALAVAPMLHESSASTRTDRFVAFVDQDWATPTLPVLAVLANRPQAYERLRRVLVDRKAADADLLPPVVDGRFEPGALPGACIELRAQGRTIAAPAREALRRSDPEALGLFDLCAGPATRLLNHYGAAGAIRTIAYPDALRWAMRDPDRLASEVGGRTLYVGYSEPRQLDRFEQFATPYTRRDRVGVSGVELLATAYANLESGTTLETRGNPAVFAAVAAAAGAAAGLFIAPLIAIAVVVAGLLSGLLAAVLAFGRWHVVFPLVMPLASAGIGMAVAIWVQMRRAQALRRRAETVVTRFVPVDVARQLTEHQAVGSRTIDAICIHTDAVGFTRFAEGRNPAEIADWAAGYLRRLGAPIEAHGGTIMDSKGDSILAVWTLGPSPVAPIEAALSACLDMIRVIDDAPAGDMLPTRIGVSMGPLTFSLLESPSHLEYRVFGDTVNVANRTEALNKALSTRILVNDTVARAARGFAFRDLGEHRVPGRTQVLHVHELLGRSDAPVSG